MLSFHLLGKMEVNAVVHEHNIIQVIFAIEIIYMKV